MLNWSKGKVTNSWVFTSLTFPNEHSSIIFRGPGIKQYWQYWKKLLHQKQHHTGELWHKQ